ncbi:MAG TPA: flavin reductase family protein [Ramlibacter sp.]|nr:flavin reductase family protein [Ramlibacter sp.]
MYLVPGQSPQWRPTIFNSLVVPRPIGWIGTLGPDGAANLAPFSYFNALSSNPPMVMFCANASHAEGGNKDSLRNARTSGEFTANLATWELREAMNLSSTPAPRAVDEFEVAGLEKAASRQIAAPRVARAPVSLECRVVQVVDLPTDEATGQTNTMVVGRVVAVHIRDDLFDARGRVNVMGEKPLTRLGGFQYGVVGEIFEMPRPGWPLKEAAG